MRTKPLKMIPDERGWLMEMLRNDDELFIQFGQVYVTAAYPGVVKAWHYHKKQWDHFVCVHGMMKLVLYDSREGSPTKGLTNEFYMSVSSPTLLKIPAGVQHGFKAVGNQDAMILNVPTNTYDHAHPDELRRPFDDPEIGYDWALKHG